jgi:hypothetical protein
MSRRVESGPFILKINGMSTLEETHVVRGAMLVKLGVKGVKTRADVILMAGFPS